MCYLLNFVATNPELLDVTRRQGGMNLVNGTLNLLEGEKPVGAENSRSGAISPSRLARW